MQKAKLFLIISSFCVSSLSVFAQQIADTLYNPEISNPVYTRGNGPIILIDDAHSNFHTLNGRFRPFANVLEKDGYILHPSSVSFTKEQLSEGILLLRMPSILQIRRSGHCRRPLRLPTSKLKSLIAG